MASEVSPYFTVTLQPVDCSKGCTQSELGSVDPSSVYPIQAMRLSWPSPGPMLFRACAPPPLLPPHAAPTSTAADSTAATRHVPFMPPPPQGRADRSSHPSP
jgi:hypothetical protein